MIPKDWLNTPIGTVCRSIVPGRNKPKKFDGNIPWITTPNITQKYIYADHARLFVSEEEIKECGGKIVPAGAVIINCVGDFGIIGIAKQKLVINQQLHAFVCPNGLSNEYIYYALSIQTAHMVKVATTTTIPYMNKSSCESIPVFLPPLLEQCRIAEVLGVWDESIDLLERLIGRVRSRKQGLMQQLLTGKKRFKEFEGSEWKKGLVSDLIKSLDAGVSVNSEDRCIKENELGILKTSAVTYGIFAPDENKVILSEEVARATINPLRDRIIISRMNTPNLVGASVYISKDYLSLFLPDRLWQAEPKSNNFSMRWLSYVLASDIYREKISNLATGTSNSMKNIAKSSILKMSIVIPSLPEQEKIAAVLSAADEEISTLEKQLAAYKQQKLGLMQQLLTGRIRI